VTASAADVLATARSQIGTVERPAGSNRTPYGAEYGGDGQAWCAKFVWWVFRKSLASSLIPKAAFTPTFARWFRDKGQWGNTPRPGAVVFFDFPNDRMHRISHVGLVEAVNSDGTITTIEGNTSSGLRGSQRDGDGVWRRRRRTGIVGCGYPAYGRRDLPPASLTAKSDKAGREDVNEASPAIVDLMSEDQRSLANGLMVLLGEVELLRPIAARKWKHKHDGDVDAEEWTVGELRSSRSRCSRKRIRTEHSGRSTSAWSTAA